MSNPNCPQCGEPLQRVRQSENSMLNSEQFDAIRAGDYFCEGCPPNGRSRTAYCYWWESEVTN